MTMIDLNFNEILQATQARQVSANAPSAKPLQQMVYDSRKVASGDIFLCIPGTRVDGHDFIGQAVSQGAGLVIGQNAEKLTRAATDQPSIRYLLVDDSLKALQKLATYYRKKFDIPVIGLTGSSGKTTTKDLMASIFKYSNKSALITEGTLNNHWGVPQMVLRLRKEHQAAAFEMGTSGFGEIQNLSSICQPRIGYITTIGTSHLDKLGDEKGVLKAKRELFDWIKAHNSNPLFLFNIDNPYLEKLHREFKNGLTISATRSDTDIHLVSAKALGFEDRFGWAYEFTTPWGKVSGKLPLPGQHNLFNAMAASALALLTEVIKTGDIAGGLQNPHISKLRSDLFKTSSGAIGYDDSYNSNPTSVTALFEAAKQIRAHCKSDLSRTIAVVGDMLELGPNSAALHKSMGKLAAREGIDLLLATGTFGKEWVNGYLEKHPSGTPPTARCFKDQDALMTNLKKELKNEPTKTLVLIKGSRGAKMDQIVARMKSEI